jgi:hypothetical protein
MCVVRLSVPLSRPSTLDPCPFVEGCWSPESAACSGAFLSWEGPLGLLSDVSR